MPLSVHRQLHLNAARRDADDLEAVEGARVRAEVDALLAETTAWPAGVGDADIHDYLERPDDRAMWRAVG